VTWVSVAAIAVGVLGVLGVLIGSFLNVVVYRLPLGLSLASPPSACTGCGQRIKAYDNIPVLSWLMLRGRCRNCKAAISVRYPLVELGTAVLFGVVASWFVSSGDNPSVLLRWPWSAPAAAGVLTLAAFLYLGAISIALALIDLDTHRLPNPIVLPAYLVGGALIASAGILTGDYDALVRAGVGLAALWLAYFAMAWFYPGGMGFGDVKLAGVLGLYLGWLGWGPLAVGFFAAFLLGGLFALVLVITRRANRNSGIPFGPWMLAGAWVGIFFGAPIATGYLSLFGLA
jgi:leader peptidase (prepilin peptidase)/N-methyltransferase